MPANRFAHCECGPFLRLLGGFSSRTEESAMPENRGIANRAAADGSANCALFAKKQAVFAAKATSSREMGFRESAGRQERS
jgi:hypothetical protein